MDFLDSIDLNSKRSAEAQTHKKARRVKSWYLYEQFKALEKNQMQAAQQLKDRSYQELLLHDEMRERRARRRLVDEFSMSDSGIDRISSDMQTCFKVEINDSFQSFSRFHNTSLHDTDSTSVKGLQECPDQSGDNLGERGDDAMYDCNNRQDVVDIAQTNSLENFINTHSNYITENFFDRTGDTNLADDFKEGLEYSKIIIAENINLQLETVKENIQCLEEFTKLHEGDVSNIVKYDVDHKDASVTTPLQDPVERLEIDHRDASITTLLQDVVRKLDIDHKDASITTLLQDSVEELDIDHGDASITTLLQDSVEKLDIYHGDASITTLLRDPVEEMDVDPRDTSITSILQDPVEKLDVDHRAASIMKILPDPVEKLDIDNREASLTTLIQDPMEKLDIDYKHASVTTLLQCPVEKHAEYENNLFTMWAKIVSFAYQVIQLNHGNCYYDYSSQVLTAVLACDVLCRGLHRICNILQPYVSPIKFLAEMDDEPQIQPQRDSVYYIERHRKKFAISAKSKRNFRKESMKSFREWKNISNAPIIFYICGDSRMQRCGYSGYISSDKMRCQTSGERGASLHILPPIESCITKSTSSLWPEDLGSTYSEDDVFTDRKKVANPMIKLANYIDTLLKDVGDNF